MHAPLFPEPLLDQYIIIHGTWTPPFSWHMPGGDFYNALAKALPPGSVTFFLWSGKNHYQARIDAAQELVQFLKDNYQDHERINLVTHSHGSNVGILASQMIAKETSPTPHIHCFYALGTPVNTANYMPDMKTIDYFYNLFSFQDFIQPVFGLFKREYPRHSRIANICVTVNEQSPQHSELHHPLIAKWIPTIHETLQRQSIGNFEHFAFEKPGVIHFVDTNIPQYREDNKRTALALQDQKTIARLNDIVRKRGILRQFVSENDIFSPATEEKIYRMVTGS